MLEFLKQEWLSILSIILSGAISWGVSAIYFYKGNRSSLQSAIIIPLITITNEPVTRKNYAEVKDISRSPLTRFFHKDEKKKFFKLVTEYRFVCSYNENSTNATAVVTDIEHRLKNMDINPRCIPVELDDGSYEYVYPEEINYLHSDIERVFEKCCWQTETKECTQQILMLIKCFAKKLYTSNFADLCKDYDLKTIIDSAEITDKWNWKFDKYNKAKQEFEALRIVKKSQKFLDN